MTDKEKLEKVRAEIERRIAFFREQSAKNVISDDNSCMLALQGVLFFIDSMQKEPKECMYSKDNYTDEDRKVLCGGCEEECEFNKKEKPVSEELEKVVEEIVDPTVLNAYGVKEIARRLHCSAMGKPIEPPSEDLEEAAIQFATDTETGKVDVVKQSSFFWGAIYHKQQLMAKTVDAKACAVYPLRNCNEVHYSVQYPIGVLPQKDGDKVKVIIIKED